MNTSEELEMQKQEIRDLKNTIDSMIRSRKFDIESSKINKETQDGLLEFFKINEKTQADNTAYENIIRTDKGLSQKFKNEEKNNVGFVEVISKKNTQMEKDVETLEENDLSKKNLVNYFNRKHNEVRKTENELDTFLKNLTQNDLFKDEILLNNIIEESNERINEEVKKLTEAVLTLETNNNDFIEKNAEFYNKEIAQNNIEIDAINNKIKIREKILKEKKEFFEHFRSFIERTKVILGIENYDELVFYDGSKWVWNAKFMYAVDRVRYKIEELVAPDYFEKKEAPLNLIEKMNDLTYSELIAYYYKETNNNFVLERLVYFYLRRRHSKEEVAKIFLSRF